MGFEGEQRSWLLISITVSSGLSFVSCVFVLLSFLFLKERAGTNVARQERHLIITLQVVDLLHSGGLLLTWVNGSSTMCYIQGVIAEVACVSIFVLSSCFATHMLLLSKNTSRSKLRKYEPMYYVVLVLWTTSFALIPVIGDEIGRAGLWCWVKQSNQDWLYRFVALYLILLVTWTYDVIVYIFVGIRVKNLIQQSTYLNKDDIQRTKRMIRQMAVYPIIMMILWGFAVANRVHDTLYPDDPSFFLFLLEAIFSPLNGFADAIAYSWTTQLSRRYVLWWRSKKVNRKGRPGESINQTFLMESDFQEESPIS